VKKSDANVKYRLNSTDIGRFLMVAISPLQFFLQ